MKPSPYKPRELFLHEFPSELLKAITKSVFDGYKEAYDYCQGNFDKYQMHDLLPHMRKAIIERNVLYCVQRFSYTSGKSAPNALYNCYHALVKCGNAVLTISAVNSPSQMVREAMFRKQYARDSQITMFVDSVPTVKLHNNLYAILLHGPSEDFPSAPCFIKIRFPDISLKKYLDEPIDLTLISEKESQEVIRKPAVATRTIAKTGNDEK